MSSRRKPLISGLLALGFVGLLTFWIAGRPVTLIKEVDPNRSGGQASEFDPTLFALALAQELPSTYESRFVRELDRWQTDHPPQDTSAGRWHPTRMLLRVGLSYFLCFSAMFVSGFSTFLIFQYLALPASPKRKSLLFTSFLLITAIPSAVLGWLWLPELVSRLDTPLVWLLGHFEIIGDAQEGAIRFLKAELVILAAMILGDGLMGTMFLRARALTATDSFQAELAGHWASARLKGNLLPFPGTLAVGIWRSLSRAVFPNWISLLGRFLVTEIILELTLKLIFRELSPRGVGIYFLELQRQGAPAQAFLWTALAMAIPLVLISAWGARFDEQD